MHRDNRHSRFSIRSNSSICSKYSKYSISKITMSTLRSLAAMDMEATLRVLWSSSIERPCHHLPIRIQRVLLRMGDHIPKREPFPMTVESRWLSRSRAASNSSLAAVFCLETLEKIHKYQKYRLAAPTRKLWDQTTLVMVRRARAVKWCIQLHLIRNHIMLMEVVA